MSDDEFVLRHVVLYAKGHYIWSNIVTDLKKICWRINEKTKELKHVIMIIAPLVYATIKEFSESADNNITVASTPEDCYRDQWLFMLSLREEFVVSFSKHPGYFKLGPEEQKAMLAIFQEEFDKRVMQAFIMPLAGWRPNVDLGDADPKILPVSSPEKKKKDA